MSETKINRKPTAKECTENARAVINMLAEDCFETCGTQYEVQEMLLSISGEVAKLAAGRLGEIGHRSYNIEEGASNV